MTSVARTSDHERAIAGQGVGTGCVHGAGHRMRVVGSVRPGSGTRVDCEQPLRAVCLNGCDLVQFWRCESYGCEPCGEVKRKRLSRLVDNGAAIHLGNGMIGYFLTLT